MEKGKKKRVSSAGWARGKFGPAERGRARPRGQAAHLAHQRGNGAGTAPWAWAHVPEGGGGDGVRGDDVGGRTDRSRPPVRLRGGSPSWSQFRVVEEVAKHRSG